MVRPRGVDGGGGQVHEARAHHEVHDDDGAAAVVRLNQLVALFLQQGNKQDGSCKGVYY